jgi:hypothetical protein
MSFGALQHGQGGSISSLAKNSVITEFWTSLSGPTFKDQLLLPYHVKSIWPLANMLSGNVGFITLLNKKNNPAKKYERLES